MNDNAIAAADEAIARVYENADVPWTVTALRVIAHVASTKGTFTTDDVWDELATTGASTHEPRAMGAMMRIAVREGLIVGTSTYLPSVRSTCHGRPVKVWEAV